MTNFKLLFAVKTVKRLIKSYLQMNVACETT